MHFPQIEKLFKKSTLIGLLLLVGLAFLSFKLSTVDWKKLWRIMIENKMWECLIEEGQL